MEKEKEIILGIDLGLIGFKYENPHVQKDIESMKPLKTIEVPKTKKTKYVIKVNDEDKEYFPEDVSY